MKLDIDTYAEGAVLLDGLEEAIIGVCEEFNGNPRILYDKDKILEILCVRDGMTTEEAEEFYDYNILGLYVSEQNPIFLDRKVIPNKINNGWEFELV